MSHNRRPFDIAKLDFEGNRKRRRKKLIVWSLPAVILVVGACLWLLLPYAATAQAGRLLEGDTKAAAGWLNSLDTHVFYERYKLPLNKGIVATKAKQFDTADVFFKEAITLAPDTEKCFIHVQSVLSGELAGDAAVLVMKYEKAITYYTKSLSEISNYKACFADYADLSVRINDKLAEAVMSLSESSKTATNSQQKNDSSSTNTSTEVLPSQKQLDTLDKLRQLSQANKQADEQSSGTGEVYTGKGW